MTDKILYLNHYAKKVHNGEEEAITNQDINASDMLKAIAEQKPKHVFVISWPEDGSLPTYHSSAADLPTVLYRLQEFIHKVFAGEFT